MSWSHWLRSRPKTTVTRPSARSSSRPRPLRSILCLEVLEDRLVLAGNTVLAVSLAATLSDTAAGNVQGPGSVSADGRYVVYTNSAANLAPGQVMDSKSASDVFLFDRSAGTTTLVSHASDSTKTTARGTSKNAAISADGNYIAYASNSDNLVSGEILANDSYTLSLGASGGTFALTYGGHTASGIPYNASRATIEADLAGLAGVGTGNVKVTGSSPGPFTITFTGTLVNAVSTPLTADGSGLTYSGGISNFVFAGGHNEFLCDQYWVFLYNVQTGANTLVSHVAADQGTNYQTTVSEGTSGILTGAEGGLTSLASQTTSVSISGDGSSVVYLSTGAHLLNGQLQGSFNTTNPPLLTRANVFVYNRSADTSYLVSRKDGSPTNADGAPTTPGDNTSYVAVIDQNGDTIAFTNQSVNLVHGQTINHNYGDIQGETPQFFVAKRSGASWVSTTMALASHDLTGATDESITNTGAPWDYPAPVLTADGHWLVYLTDNAIVQSPISGTFAGQGDNYYLYDTTSPTSVSNNTLITHTPGNSTQVGNAGPDSFVVTTAPSAAVSDNGQYVAFYSAATNLTSTATSAGYNVFLFNRDASDTTHNVTLITNKSIPVKDFPATTWPPLAPSISGDGRYVAYVGFATADVSGLTNLNTLPGSMGLDALLYDQGSNPGPSTPTYKLLSHDYNSTTTTGTGEAYSPVVSENGSAVVYLDDSSNLIQNVNGKPGQDLNAALPTDGTDLYAYSLTTPSAYTPQAANGINATVTLRDPSLPSLTGNGQSEISPVHAVSSDGRFVVFFSNAPNLVANEVDSSLTLNVYLYDSTTATTILLSHAAGASATTGDGESTNAVISGDGKTVLFYSFATNLSSGQTPAGGTVQLYLYDNDPGSGTYRQLKLVSHTSASATAPTNGTIPFSPSTGTLLYSGSVTHLPLGLGDIPNFSGLALPSVSDNGQYIAYLSNATNLSGSNTGSANVNVFLYDRGADTSTLVSHTNGATTTANDVASAVAISGDGSTIAFFDKATDLLAGAIANGGNDELYVYSRIDNASVTGLSAGQVRLASHSAASFTTAATVSALLSLGSLPPSLSSNGAYVAYYFGGTNLVTGPSASAQSGTASATNVFRFEVRNNVNDLVSFVGDGSGDNATAGDNPTNAKQTEASGPAISSDGRFIAYANNSTNLTATLLTGQNGQDNVYLYDANAQTNHNTLVSHADNSSTAADANGGTSASISPDGRYVTFIDLAIPPTVADRNCTFSASAYVRLYDSQASATAQPTVLGGAFDPTPLILVQGTLAPTDLVLGANGPVAAWDGLAAKVAPVPGDRNTNLDVFFYGPGATPVAPTDITLAGAGSVPLSTASPSSTTVGKVAATPTNQTYTYTLVPPATGTNNNNLFTLDLNTGVLKTATTFNVTTATSYTITVQATNAADTTLFLDKNFTLIVYPAITSLTLALTTPPPTTVSIVGTTVGTLTTTDPNPGQTWTYLLSGPNAGKFTVDSSGVIQTAITFATSSGSFPVTVQVTDTLGLTLTQTFTVIVYQPITKITLAAAVPPATTASPVSTTVGTFSTTDPNTAGQTTFTYVLTNPNPTLFKVVSGNVLQTATTFATAQSVDVGVKVTDAVGLTLTQTVTVAIYQPITKLALAFAVPPPTTVSIVGTTVGTLTTTDPNPGQTTFTYALSGPNAGKFTVDSSGAIQTAITFANNAGSFPLTVQVTDTLGLTLTQTFTVIVYQPITKIGVVAVTPSVTTDAPANTVVATLATTDPNANQGFTYLLLTNTGLFHLAADGKTILSSGPQSAQAYTISVQVTDTLGLTLTQDVTITVYQPITKIDLTLTTPPPTKASTANTTVGTLTTTDPNPGQTAFAYSLSGPNASLFTVDSSGAIKTTGTLTGAGPLSLTVQVTDTAGVTLVKTFTIVVYQPISQLALAPVVPVLIGSPAGTTLGTLTTTDPNPGSTPFSYITVAPNAGQFSVDASGVLKAATTLATAGPVNVGVQVTDAFGLTLTQTFTVTIYQPITKITLTPAIPPVTTASMANATVGTLTTTDPNPGQTAFTYSLSGPNASLFTVDSSGAIKTTGTLTGAGPLSLTVQVTDTAGVTLVKTFTITVYQPINQLTLASAAPVLIGSPAGTTLGTLTTTDPNPGSTPFSYITVAPNAGQFSVDASGVLKAATTLATAGPVNVGVQVTDAFGLTLTQTFTVTIYQPITKITFTLAVAPLTTASTANATVGTLTTTDPNPGQTAFTYTLSGPNASLFTVDSNGVLKTAGTFSTPGQFTVTVLVTDKAGVTLSQDVTVTVYQLIAQVTLEAAATPVTTSSPVGTTVGTLVTADPNSGQSLTYTLTGANAKLFTVNASGVLQTAATFSMPGSVGVTVLVTDTAGVTFTQTFTVTVNPAPITDVALSNQTVAGVPGTVVGTFSTTDPNPGQTFGYSLVSGPGGADNGAFTLSGATLTTASGFPTGTQASYSVLVRSTDALGLFLDKAFLVVVNNFPPTDLKLSGGSVVASPNSAVGTFSATDADAGETFTYSLVAGADSTANSLFTVSGNTLLTAPGFPTGAAGSYRVRVRATDSGPGNLFVEKAFTITVIPNAVTPPPASGKVATDIVYVNPAWAGLAPGANPAGPGGPLLSFGVNAFASIQAADNAVTAGGTLVVEGGTYAGGFDVNRAGVVQLAGDVTLNAGGAPIAFHTLLSAAAAGAESLTILSGGGNVLFNDVVGLIPLANLTIANAHSVTFVGKVNLTGTLLETGTGDVILNGGTVGGSVDVTSKNVTLATGTLNSGGNVSLKASDSLDLAAGTTLQAGGTAVLDGGYNNPAGGAIVIDGTVNAAVAALNGGPGNDTIKVSTTGNVALAVDGGGGSNTLTVDLSGTSAAQTVLVTAGKITSSALSSPVLYSVSPGNFGGGVNVLTGAGNDNVTVESTVAGDPTLVNTGAGNDSIAVASSTDLTRSTLDGLQAPLTIEGGPGSNALTVSEAARQAGDTVFFTPKTISGKGFPSGITYQATGGTFGGGVNFAAGAGSDTIAILGLPAGAPTKIYGRGGNDTFNIAVTPSSNYKNLTLDGGDGTNALGVFDQTGTAVVHDDTFSPGVGLVQVSYLKSSSVINDQNMQQVGGNIDADTSFIQSLYHEEMGYNAGATDLNYWLGVLHGQGRQAAVDGIDRSGPALTRTVTTWYQQYLGRAPKGGEEQVQVARIQNGDTEEVVLSDLLASSPEYASLSDSVYLEQLFAKLLGRAATSDEVSVYVNTLLPQVGRNGAAWLIATSPDYRRPIIAKDFSDLLGRAIDPGDLDTLALGGTPLLQLREQIELSPEFGTVAK